MKLTLNVPMVKQFMQKKGWDERDLARHMGISYTTVYRAMRGQRGVGGLFVKKLMCVVGGDLALDDVVIDVTLLPGGNENQDKG